MADITGIFGGSFAPGAPKRTDPPEQQLADAMRAAGISPPTSIIMDGRLRRFSASGKQGDDAGWYVAFGDGVPAGQFGNWRTGDTQSWRAETGRTLTAAEEMAHMRRMAEARAARDDERAKLQASVDNAVETIWNQAGAASGEHPYLARKGVQPHGLRITGDGRLMAPLRDVSGHLHSIQYIDVDGAKLYHPGGRAGGMFWMLGAAESGPIYLAEGFATAATIQEATGARVAVCFSAQNIPSVTGALRAHYGSAQELIIVADNDASGVGLNYANQAAAQHGARVVCPPAEGTDANDFAQAGGDLLGLLHPPVSDWLTPADEFCAQPAPVSWLVKRWLQSTALIMVHGPSGGGKTFAVLDMVLHIAAGLPEWRGHKVKPGGVVYLAGEGHHGLRARIAAWKQHRNAGPLSMWVSRSGCDLNTPAGYAKAREAILALRIRPAIIVVDTLHRFLNGDENSAQDAKTMLDACAALMEEFSCSVLLVHHTGVSEEAQHRARGSSAWRGALDIEISVTPQSEERPLTLTQRKTKDAETPEPMHGVLERVAINGWIDEDGEQVTSAVFNGIDAPQARPSSKALTHLKVLRNCWAKAGYPLAEDGRPGVTRDVVVRYLINDLQKAERTALEAVKPSRTDQMIGMLIVGNMISINGEHFSPCSDELISQWMIERASLGGRNRDISEPKDVGI